MGSVGSKIKKFNPGKPTEPINQPEAKPADTRVTLARVVVPPAIVEHDAERKSIFLAGAIDQGRAVEWQAELIDKLRDLPITIYNPRRADWDPSWKQDIDFKPFRDQVEWELGWMDKVTFITMYLPPDSSAPISLLELGLYASTGRLLVACPSVFHRRGNVEIVCKRYNVPFFETFEALEEEVRRRLTSA